LDPPFQLVVLEQPNRGQAAARNRGAEEARGELLLFLDDDMEADERLLSEHDRSHRQGADVVLGHVPLHPDSPRNFLSAAVRAWADTRACSLSARDAAPGLHDLLTGQMSIRRDLFWKLGGFDVTFNERGRFGNEDLDFGYRVLRDGRRIVFNPTAVSWQRYVVTPRQHLRQWREAGRATVLFARKHSDEIDAIVGARREHLFDRLVLRWSRLPARALVLLLARVAPRAWSTSRMFFRVRDLEYFQGMRDGGGMPATHPVRVLCYHSLSDLLGAPVIERYGVPPKRFGAHLELLSRHFRFIGPEEFLRYLDGAGVPRRAVLLTFDDCYQDLVDVGLPLLRERGIPAVAFAVTCRLGAKNDWDHPIGAAQLPLASAEDLRRLVTSDITIGSHTRTHRVLTRLEPSELAEELSESRADLEALAIPSIPMLAYPHGEHDEVVRQAARDAGYAGAFTIEPGLVRTGAPRYALPRLEIVRNDRGLRLLWKVIRGGRPLLPAGVYGRSPKRAM